MPTPLPPMPPPEVWLELLGHLRVAGREVVLGVQTALAAARKNLPEGDPAAELWDAQLRAVEQGLGIALAFLPGGRVPATPEDEALREAVVERVETTLSELRDQAKLGNDPQVLALEALVRDLQVLIRDR